MNYFLRRYNKLFILITLTLIFVQGCYINSIKSMVLPTTELATTECKIIKHTLGESCIPFKPQRIVTLDENIMEALLALDLKPIATTQPNIAGSIIPKLGNKAEGIVSLGKESQPNIEKIIQLKPDLILGFFIGAEKYKLFSQIAPTIQLDYIQADWKNSLLKIGEITDRSEKVQELLEQYQQRIQNLRAFINKKLKRMTVSISRFYAGNQVTEFRTKYSFPGSLLTEVGISMPEMQKQLTTNENQPLVSVSLEQLKLLDADILFVALDPGAETSFQKYQNSQLWQQLNVVKNNQVYTVDSGYWIFGNILSATAILEDLLKYLTNNLNN
ncbi:MAG TPA: iron-siderophore ABC transporter substrate-binding protein [Trichormus sp. M33_DOE_039]|nr:iron-siderophore ABC transporter substrate-binding protein [Trichormus sp. M33_DOE_039]